MEGFWETVRDWALLIIKVFVVLFFVDAVLYLLGYSMSIPYIRDAVVLFFYALGYSKPY